ncbi:MAG: DUF3267 domain-containing protein [Oscillospiraceae bacterium]|nr:DUF3267 domain-containing protein [Oscillospiraceae bacterium]
MKAYQALPEEYREIVSIDLKNDKKLFWKINGLCIAIMALMIFLASGKGFVLTMLEPIEGLALRLMVLGAGTLLYIVLHELTHAVVMKLCGTKKVKFGFGGGYAYAGSDDFYDKWGYITIALSPVLLWGLVLALICMLVPREWFFVAYFIQILNVSGAAGDFYVTFRFISLPSDILVHDSGTSMKVYSKK